MSTVEYDVGVLETIARLLEEHNNTDQSSNRREDVRHDFICQQLIAEYDGASVPRGDQLRLVQCVDLSPNGFSYVSTTRPRTQQLLVGLGQIPFHYFVAEVIHVAPVGPAEQGESRIGCRFLSRWNPV